MSRALAIRPSYREARELFREVAQARGFGVVRHALTGLTGLEGEELSIDVAAKGEGNRLVLVSGVHGVEGFAGSACQIDCMRRVDYDGIKVVLIHALNPYGFSFSSRINENRVDLNRNFDGLYPGEYNARYSDVHEALAEILAAAVDEPPARADIGAWLTHCSQSLGRSECLAVVTGGQYRHQDGLFYGGRELQPSVRVLERIVSAHFGPVAARAFTIDFHTGLGAPGHGELIYTGRAKDRAWELAQSWLADRVTCPESGDSASKEVRGSAQAFFVREQLARESSYVALEFGTVPIDDMIAALCEDIWLRARLNVRTDVAGQVRADLRAAFRLDDLAWETAVLDRAVQVVSRAVASLRS